MQTEDFDGNGRTVRPPCSPDKDHKLQRCFEGSDGRTFCLLPGHRDVLKQVEKEDWLSALRLIGCLLTRDAALQLEELGCPWVLLLVSRKIHSNRAPTLFTSVKGITG